MEEAYAEMIRLAEKSDWSVDVKDVFLNLIHGSLASLLQVPLSEMTRPGDHEKAELERRGDVIVGFISDAEDVIEIDIEIGGVAVRGGPLQIHPGRVTYFFDDPDKTFFPIIAIAFSQVFAQCKRLQNISAIYGLISPTEVRRHVAQSTHWLPQGAVVTRGVFGYPCR